MYLKVSNVGELPLHGIRLLGESSKRSDQIGQFGTGLKEAIALSIRSGLTVLIHSGLNEIDFKVIQLEEGAPDEIVFQILKGGNAHFPEGSVNALNISPKFGKHDWNNHWQILREIFCNALDEGILDHKLVETPEAAKPGITTVYLGLSEELLAAYKELPTKLLQLAKPTPLANIQRKGEIFNPIDSVCAIYHKGVFVQRFTGKSIFSYNLDRLRLNESRSADWYNVNNLIGEILSAAPKEVVVTFLKECINDSRLMEANLDYYNFNGGCKSVWTAAFAEAFGELAVACRSQQHVDVANHNGKIAILVNATMYRLLNEGVHACTIQQTCGDAAEKGIIERAVPAKTQRLFDKVWEKLETAHLVFMKAKPQLKCFTFPGTEGGAKLQGYYDSGTKTVFLNFDVLSDNGTPSREGIMTMLEEICHHTTGAQDFTRDFQNWCLDAIITFLKV